jgi:probable rRNA maturation factor
MKVDIRMDPGFGDPAVRNAIRKAAAAVLKTAAALTSGGGPGSPALTILLTGDEAIRALNARFLDTDAPTDVLAFPAGDDGALDEHPGFLEDGGGYLGDVIISLETARRQAEAGGHPLEQEVQLLAVHGILHLLGHDHAETDEKAAMWTAQTAVLADLGNPLSPP